MSARATGLVPMASVADVQRSVDFYALLDLRVRGSHQDPDGQLVWVHLQCEGAHLMLSHSSGPIDAAHQGVIFYLYSPDLVALRNRLLAHNVKVSEITYPLYMEKGEMCLSDPDGYTLLVGQIE
jgi:Glyoxalase/Bleomycin resistance protein/Dioxygenase superfamily